VRRDELTATRSFARRIATPCAAIFATGFTLIEVLVVVVILAILAAAVSIAIAGAGGERQLEREGERLEALIVYACEHAELGGRPVGLTFRPDGYQFSEADADRWVLVKQGELRERQWSGAFVPTLSRDGVRIELSAEKPPEEPHAVCFASGELTPFRFELATADLPYRWRIGAEPDGSIKRERRDVAR
jgi:general secretion pathway protein H